MVAIEAVASEYKVRPWEIARLLDMPLALLYTLMQKAADRTTTSDETSHITAQVDAARRKMKAFLEENFNIV